VTLVGLRLAPSTTALDPSYQETFDKVIKSKRPVYQACLDMIRERITHIPPPILNKRILFFSLSMQLMAAREAALEGSRAARAYREGPEMVAQIVDSLCEMLLAPLHAQDGRAARQLAPGGGATG
jgi:hypothetical protein